MVEKAPLITLPGDEINESILSSKKSDRSSDESSFDVVEAAGEEDEEDKKTGGAFFSVDTSLQGDNESSMVVVDHDTSTSSHYQSADETLSARSSAVGTESKQKKQEKQPLPVSKSEPVEEDISEPVTASESESIAMHSLHGEGNASSKSGNEKTKPPTPQAMKTDESATKARTISDTGSANSINPMSESPKVLTASETARTIAMCQNSASTVSKTNIFNLVDLLRTNSQTLKPSVLDCIVRVSVFSHNNVSCFNFIYALLSFICIMI